LQDRKTRELGARLLLSEVLEYVISGLGVIPEVKGVKITEPDAVKYRADRPADTIEMLDGLADTAYTMYWNSISFGLPLEEAFDLVCHNNLEKFVLLTNWQGGERELTPEEWGCGQNITWPREVVKVQVVKVGSDYYGVGKDDGGKVRKPSSYQSVRLEALLEKNG
jgi:hypothetical protein